MTAPTDKNRLYVEVSADAMQAVLKLPRSGYKLTIEEVTKALQEASVDYGVNDIILEWLVKSTPVTTEIVVANGLPVRLGKTGWIDYKFDTEAASHAGKPIHTAQYKLQNVEAGTVLAVRFPAVQGSDGRNVYGQIVEPPPVKDLKIVAGDNVKFSDASSCELVAVVAGCVHYDPLGKVSVLDHLTLACDVDNAVGNIEFYGDLTIRGDVKSGFEVKTRNKLVVEGTVEEAILEAEAIEIRGGFVGPGEGVARAKTEFSALFVINQTVEAGQDIKIFGEVRAAVLNAGRSIFIQGTKGVVLGGRLEAHQSIEANVLGNPISYPAQVTVGRPKELLQQLAVLENEITVIRDRMAVMRLQFGFPPDLDPNLENPKFAHDTPAGRSFELLRKVGTKLQITQQEYEHLFKQLDDHSKSCFVRVKKECYPGILLQIGTLQRTVEERTGPAVFRISEGDIIHVRE
ncbi:MAG: FapA family protein [bacterium]|nr:FapA family protein [bacterium]